MFYKHSCAVHVCNVVSFSLFSWEKNPPFKSIKWCGEWDGKKIYCCWWEIRKEVELAGVTGLKGRETHNQVYCSRCLVLIFPRIFILYSHSSSSSPTVRTLSLFSNLARSHSLSTRLGYCFVISTCILFVHIHRFTIAE